MRRADDRRPRKRGQSQGRDFLESLVGTERADCILWPFAKLPEGYGNFGVFGRHYYSHRYMCELAHGKPPPGRYEAAHSCDNPQCVNPNHLSWKTASQNQLDRRRNGTHATSKYGNRGGLSPRRVQEIRREKGMATNTAVAAKYGVSRATVRRIWNEETYLPGKPRGVHTGRSRILNDDQIAELRATIGSVPDKEWARRHRVSIGTITYWRYPERRTA